MAKDATGNGHDGTVVGDVSSGTDTVGTCGVFNGGYIQVPSSTDLDLDAPFTINVWIKTDPTALPNTNVIISKKDDDGSDSDYYLLAGNDTGLQWYGQYGDTQGENNPGAYLSLSDSWNMVTEVNDGSNMLIYDNAELLDSEAQPSTPLTAGSGNVLIGSYIQSGSSSFFKGKMADLRIYNNALSADDIKALYNTNSYSDKIVLQIDNPDMTVDGVQQEIDPGRGTSPTTIEDRTVVPIVAIIDAMGGTVAWDGTDQERHYHPQRKHYQDGAGRYHRLRQRNGGDYGRSGHLDQRPDDGSPAVRGRTAGLQCPVGSIHLADHPAI